MDPTLLARSAIFAVCDVAEGSLRTTELAKAFGFELRTLGSGDEFLAAIGALPPATPACAVIQLESDRGAGFAIHQDLVQRESTVGSIIIAKACDCGQVVRAMRTGAVSVLDAQTVRDNELWSLLLEGLERSDEEIRRRIRRTELEGRFRTLALQDRQVLELLMQGAKNRIIAKRLDVSLRTVENRRRRIFDVMQADSVAELTRLVVEFEYGLLPTAPRGASWLKLPFERVA